jgi:Tfp pilus assembly protein PilF
MLRICLGFVLKVVMLLAAASENRSTVAQRKSLQGLAHIHQKNLTEAKRLCREAVTLNPESSEAHFHMGVAHSHHQHVHTMRHHEKQERANLDVAFDSFKITLRLDPNHARAHLNLASLHTQKVCGRSKPYVTLICLYT